MIYTNGSKIIADTEMELHAYARKMRMNTQWFMNEAMSKDGIAFYPIFGNKRKEIMRDPELKYVMNAAEFITKAKAMMGHG